MFFSLNISEYSTTKSENVSTSYWGPVMEYENNVQTVTDLTNDIIGFNGDEIKDILDYVTTI